MQPANNTLPGRTRPHKVLKSLPPKALPPRPFRSQPAVIDKLHRGPWVRTLEVFFSLLKMSSVDGLPLAWSDKSNGICKLGWYPEFQKRRF
jgi:hypothetical protein